MKARTMIQSLAAVLISATLSCSLPASKLTIPEPVSVKQIVFSWSNSAPDGQEVVVTDPKTIERFMVFLQARNSGWEKPWDTFPTPTCTISLKDDKGLLLVVWLGQKWIGGREGNGDSSQNRLRSLSDLERSEALEILGIPKR